MELLWQRLSVLSAHVRHTLLQPAREAPGWSKALYLFFNAQDAKLAMKKIFLMYQPATLTLSV